MMQNFPTSKESRKWNTFLHKRKSIEFNPKMNQMLALTDKDFDMTTMTFLRFLIAWYRFSMHENFSRKEMSWLRNRNNKKEPNGKKTEICRYKMLTPRKISTRNVISKHISIKIVDRQWQRPREDIIVQHSMWLPCIRGTTIQLTSLLIRSQSLKEYETKYLKHWKENSRQPRVTSSEKIILRVKAK